ncbi:MAG: hypothetical protein ACK5PP_02135 [Acidimicrobiales bacterium]
MADYTAVMAATGPVTPNDLYGIYRPESENGAPVDPAVGSGFRIWIQPDTLHSVVNCNDEFTLGVQTGLIVDEAAGTLQSTEPAELEDQMSDGSPCRVFINLPVPAAYTISGLQLTITVGENESVYQKVADAPAS